MTSRYDAIIIGAGAAGLWAAGTAGARGRRVLVLEKNTKPGPKILMSGGTRCNITQNCSSRAIADAFGRQGRSLLGVLDRLSPQDVVEQFRRMGVETKVEETGKIFPSSDRAIDVRDALVRRLRDAGAELQTGCAVQHVLRSPIGVGFEVRTEEHTWYAEKILITTGGLSFSGCGTTGDGYPWVTAFGHQVTPLRPALTPLLSSAEWVHRLSGITLNDVAITAVIASEAEAKECTSGKAKSKSKNSKERSSSRGGFLWTHFGCSGPTAMNVSRCFTELNDYSDARLNLDLLPDASRATLLQSWNRMRSEGSRSVINELSSQLPRRIAEALMEQSGISVETRTAELSNRLLDKLLENLKSWPIPIHGTRGYPKAEVTAGGVELNEINFQKMESKIVPGLHLAGEILDLDGPIGGYNFQAAWSTGHTAGLHL